MAKPLSALSIVTWVMEGRVLIFWLIKCMINCITISNHHGRNDNYILYIYAYLPHI